MERSCSIKLNSQIIGDALRDALERVTLAELNHQMPKHERHKKDKIISIEPAMAEGVR